MCYQPIATRIINAHEKMQDNRSWKMPSACNINMYWHCIHVSWLRPNPTIIGNCRRLRSFFAACSLHLRIGSRNNGGDAGRHDRGQPTAAYAVCPPGIHMGCAVSELQWSIEGRWMGEIFPLWTLKRPVSEWAESCLICLSVGLHVPVAHKSAAAADWIASAVRLSVRRAQLL